MEICRKSPIRAEARPDAKLDGGAINDGKSTALRVDDEVHREFRRICRSVGLAVKTSDYFRRKDDKSLQSFGFMVYAVQVPPETLSWGTWHSWSLEFTGCSGKPRARNPEHKA